MNKRISSKYNLVIAIPIITVPEECADKKFCLIADEDLCILFFDKSEVIRFDKNSYQAYDGNQKSPSLRYEFYINFGSHIHSDKVEKDLILHAELTAGELYFFKDTSKYFTNSYLSK